ncbi:MAG: energy-coupling factor transporter transmembrane component T [Bifidobacteriaceae bacterium]|nr:energy-coupling factor transporter transmembrane component T [Bifidobacteriaceae bacterium]
MDSDLYTPGDGWLHRRDPRVKLLLSLALLVLCLVWRQWWLIAGALIAEHVMLATDGVPRRSVVWAWKVLAPVIVLVVVLWPLTDTSGTHEIWHAGFLRLTEENLLMAAVMGLRIPALAFACFLTLFTTSQPMSVRGLVKLGVPYKAGLTLSTALRYIPVFFSIFGQVMDAQRARGLDIGGEEKDEDGDEENDGEGDKPRRKRKRGNPFSRMVARFRSYMPVIIAVLIRAYTMSRNVGWAMETRGLGMPGVHRTYRVQVRMNAGDWLLLALTVLGTAGAIVAMMLMQK